MECGGLPPLWIGAERRGCQKGVEKNPVGLQPPPKAAASRRTPFRERIFRNPEHLNVDVYAQGAGLRPTQDWLFTLFVSQSSLLADRVVE